MAELSAAESIADPCCAHKRQATCCEPSSKADCCGQEDGCGCAASSGHSNEVVHDSIKRPRESLQRSRLLGLGDHQQGPPLAA
jgi:hypothetical protein